MRALIFTEDCESVKVYQSYLDHFGPTSSLSIAVRSDQDWNELISDGRVYDIVYYLRSPKYSNMPIGNNDYKGCFVDFLQFGGIYKEFQL